MQLPSLIKFDNYGGDWNAYIEAVYQIFKQDFIDSKPNYSKRVNQKRHPEYNGKSNTFWHLISEGKSEEDRTPNIARCERIPWPKPMIEAYQNDDIRIWENNRNKSGREKRILISLPDFSYVIVLADRKEYVLLWTAYPIEQQHRRDKLKKEYEEFKKKLGPHQ